MTADRRLERDLPRQLEGLYLLESLPDYRDELHRRIAATRQRPAWTFPGRWLPMSAITERMAAAPRVPWRAVGLLALLILALVAGALAIGSQQRRLPAPFGPAGNGLIPFVASGNLYVGDPVTGETRLLVGDAGSDAVPQFSPDGTRIAFIRDVGTGTGHLPVDVYVANADGTDRRRITPRPIGDIQWISWTPDGRRIVVIHDEQAMNRLDLFDAAGSGKVERIDAVAGIDSIEFRPPDGREALFRALVGGRYGLFVMDADGTNVRTLVPPTIPASIDVGLGNAVYSANGSRIFYQQAFPGQDDACCRLWVMNADGSDPHEFIPPPGRAWDGEPAVSPDGKWIAYWHWDARSSDTEEATQRVSVAQADGTGPVIQTGPKLPGTAHWIWAPDSSKILMYPDDGSSPSAYLLDPEGGAWTTVPWQSDADLDWQRIATD